MPYALDLVVLHTWRYRRSQSELRHSFGLGLFNRQGIQIQ
jgi:hypothetical protein